MRAIVSVEHLTKHYRRVRAVTDVSFTVRRGCVTGFLGPNGSGKTTTLRILLGLISPTSGRALVDGVEYRRLADPARVVGAVLDPAAYPARTGHDHLRALALPLGVGRRRVDEVLELVGLAEAGDRPCGSYSLGMKQRLALAGALLGDPELLVLDEPANGLDPEGIRWLRDFLRDWAAEGRTALLSSHVLAEVTQTVDHVVIIDRGRVALDAPISEIGQGSVTVRSPGAAMLADLLAAEPGLGDGAITWLADDELRLPHGWAERVGRLAAHYQIPLVELHTTGPDLEGVFFDLTSDPDRAALPDGPARAAARGGQTRPAHR